MHESRPTPSTDDELLTVPEAAVELKMSEPAVRQAIQRQQLPTVRLGRRIRLRRSEILAAFTRRDPKP